MVMFPRSVERRHPVQPCGGRTECARFQQATTGRSAGRGAGRCRLRGLGLLLLVGRSFHVVSYASCVLFARVWTSSCLTRNDQVRLCKRLNYSYYVISYIVFYL